jgi:hypothetical protein
VLCKEGRRKSGLGAIMLLDILWVIAVSAALVVFFVFYFAFAYLLFSPLFNYLIEAWKPASRSASPALAT